MKYISRPRILMDDPEQQHRIAELPHLTVYEPESNSRNTGLLDVRGHAIHAVDEFDLGFIPRKVSL